MKKFALIGMTAIAVSGFAVLGTVKASASTNYGHVSDWIPNSSLADSVMTSTVKSALGGNVKYNSAGYFVVNNNKPVIATSRTTAFAYNPSRNKYGQLGASYGVANYSTYDSLARSSKTINPAGWIQLSTLKGSHYGIYLYNRGHLLGYAIFGNLKGFNSSEANYNNIATQTAWANQADGGKQGDGQNYWESLVRSAVKAHHTVRYEVKPIYVGTNKVPVGSEIEAQGIGYNLNFNVFVPNVQQGVSINYATGTAKKVG